MWAAEKFRASEEAITFSHEKSLVFNTWLEVSETSTWNRPWTTHTHVRKHARNFSQRVSRLLCCTVTHVCLHWVIPLMCALSVMTSSLLPSLALSDITTITVIIILLILFSIPLLSLWPPAQYRDLMTERKVWKSALVTPLHKGGDRNDWNNYRPISNLSCSAKMLESFVNEQVSAFLKSYLKSWSTITAATAGVNDIVPADSERHCTAIFIELIDWLVTSVKEHVRFTSEAWSLRNGVPLGWIVGLYYSHCIFMISVH